MNIQDLRELLGQTDNKLDIFANVQTLRNYEFTNRELFELINEFLSDEEKLKLFDYSHFVNLSPYIRSKIIRLVSSDQVLLQMMNNDSIINGIDEYALVEIIKNMSDAGKQQLLHNQEFMKRHRFTNNSLYNIFSSLSEDSLTETLADTDLILNKLHLETFHLVKLLKGLSTDEEKIKMMELYQIENYYQVDLLTTCSDNCKLENLLGNKKINDTYNILLLVTLEPESLCKFLSEHKDFCAEKNIFPYKIIHQLDPDRQKEFMLNFENLSLTSREKKEILATLCPEVKQDIDTTDFPKEYLAALNMQLSEDTLTIIFDLERDLEDYRELDNLISVNPERFTADQRLRFMKLCDICPNMKVLNNLGDNVVSFSSTPKEYKEAEEWIASVIDSLKPEYSKAQKMAIVDNAIGRKMSYSPDFNTEVFNLDHCRALWKIIASGYGVCNGIAKLEQYMFSRAGIESEIVSNASHSHSFLKINDIELPLANGETVKGTTILDPTWNLANHRFGAMPNLFCVSYEQARQNDIDVDGNDHASHINDDKLQDATLNLDEQSLRILFASVGLATKDGIFPIKNLIDESNSQNKLYANNPEENISAQFMLLKQACPEFATCQDSSMNIISNVLLNHEDLRFNRCVVNRVYSKSDQKREPVLYIYIDSDELEKRFYFADKSQGQFVKLSPKEFTDRFECYDKDLEKNNGLRPWEAVIQRKETNLSQSSGRIVAEEEQER